MKENVNSSRVTLVLKIVGGLVITTILLVGVAWMTKGIWLGRVSNPPSGEEIERIRADAKHMSF